MRCSSLDADGPVRRFVPFVEVGERTVPSLPLATALMARGYGGVGVETALWRHAIRWLSTVPD